MICPDGRQNAIDLVVDPVSVSALPAELRCGDGGLAVLGGCCTPDQTFTSCNFAPGICTLESTGNVCCFVAWQYPHNEAGPILLNDCRVTGSCECSPLTQGCAANAGAQCVDITPP